MHPRECLRRRRLPRAPTRHPHPRAPPQTATEGGAESAPAQGAGVQAEAPASAANAPGLRQNFRCIAMTRHLLPRAPPRTATEGGVYLTESVHQVVLQKSIPAQIRQLILYYC